jgi:glycosyltransferase involved in cell wall biosynthesis
MARLRDLPVEWHVFGDSDAHGFPARAREAAGGRERVVFHGRYRREEIVGRLRDARIDASLLLSPWDETFCYTLSESWAAGVPAVVSDRGALAERVRATGAGAVAEDPAGAAELLRRIAGDPALLDAWRRAAIAHPEPSVADNAARHREIWGGVLASTGIEPGVPGRDGPPGDAVLQARRP